MRKLFYRSYFAEVFGSFFLFFTNGFVSYLTFNSANHNENLIFVASATSLAYLVSFYMSFNKSGSHFNPIISLAMLLLHRLPIRHFFPYLAAQLFGCFLATLLIYVISLHQTGSNLDFLMPILSYNAKLNLSPLLATILLAICCGIFCYSYVSIFESGLSVQQSSFVVASCYFIVEIILRLTLAGGINPLFTLAIALFHGGWLWNNFWVFVLTPLFAAFFSSCVCKALN